MIDNTFIVFYIFDCDVFVLDFFKFVDVDVAMVQVILVVVQDEVV